MTRLLGTGLVPNSHSTVEIEDIDGKVRSMCVHFHAYHCYVEVHVANVPITDLDAQESELDRKGYLEITPTCHLFAI